LKLALAAAVFTGLTAPAAMAQQIDIRSYGAKCDGSDDSGAVQAAFNAVGSGGTVLVSCSAGIGGSGILLQDKNNVTVAGTGGNAGFRTLAPSGLGAGNFGQIMFVVRNGTNVMVRDLTIDVQKVATSGIGFDRSTNSTIQNVSVYNVGYPAIGGILSSAGHGNSFLNNTVGPIAYVQDDGGRGMWIGNAGYDEYDATISNNTVSGSGWTGIATHVVNSKITNNLVYDTRGAGIKVTPPPGVASVTTIQGNTARGNRFHGVQIDGGAMSPSSTVNIVNNTLDANQMAGVYLMGGKYYGRISSNTITNNPSGGIYVYNGSNMQVDNNQITGNGHGLLLEVNNGYTIDGLQFTSNTVDNQGAMGISVWMRGGTLQNFAINSNSFSNNSQYGVFVEWQSGNLTGISATSNCFANNNFGTINDQSGHLSPVASSGSCAPAGSGNNGGNDTTAPQVAIASPANGATVSGTVSVTANATDNVGVTGVQFQLNGANYGPKLGSAPFTVQWDSTSVGNGSYQWTAIAQDAKGNTTTSSTVFANVNNADKTAPQVSISSPANGATVSGTVSVTASASDNVGVAGVQYSLDGAALGAELTSSPYSYSWNTSGLAAGNHTLTATARDAAGNRTSASVTVNVAGPLAVSITSPASGQTVSGVVNLSAATSSAVGVQFLMDGAYYGNEMASGFTMSCNTAYLANGAHTVSAIARDASGARKTSAAVSFTVSNSTTPPPTSLATIRVNAGGPAYTDPSGNAWSADTGFNGGEAWAPSATVSGTNTPQLYQTGRFMMNAPLAYSFQVPNGNYKVTLKFAETYFTTAGSRQMNIAINGQTVESSFDAVAAAGGPNMAVDRTYTTTVANGNMGIQLTGVVENPLISALEIVQQPTPPQVSITAPTNGATVSDKVAITATATNATGVQFQLNGANYGSKLSSAPFTVQWDTTSVANGSYQWTAIAENAAGDKTTSAAVSVTVNNVDQTAPQVSITSPANGSTFSGTVNLAASASDNVGVAGVQFSLDGSALGAELTAAPYSFSWNTGALPVGDHTLTATARDAAGNRTSASVTVKVADTVAPTVSITSPASGSTVSGAVNLTASATDNVGVVGVQFLIDGANYGNEVASGSAISCNTLNLVNGAHTVSAIARDAAGNKKTSAAVSFTVSNTTTPPPPAGAAIRVNAGGPAYTDPSGNVWSADTGFNGGQGWNPGATVSGTNTPQLYQTGRFMMNAPLVYSFQVPNGSYKVTLKFAETYFTTAGKRVMNIAINGQNVESGFDAVAAAGGSNKAVDRSYTTTVTGGSIAIQLTGTVENPLVSALEILQTAPPAKSVVRVNAGGAAYTDPSGNAWSADTGSNGGGVWAPGNAISGTNTPELYAASRYMANAPLVYTFKVNDGSYTVNLKFAETYFWAAGQRKMNIAINGQTVESNFDIFAAAGGSNKAVDRSYPVTVSGGSVTIQLTGTADNPSINAIEIK
jgi:parallel beta-helix repeat protein